MPDPDFTREALKESVGRAAQVARETLSLEVRNNSHGASIRDLRTGLDMIIGMLQPAAKPEAAKEEPAQPRQCETLITKPGVTFRCGLVDGHRGRCTGTQPDAEQEGHHEHSEDQAQAQAPQQTGVGSGDPALAFVHVLPALGRGGRRAEGTGAQRAEGTGAQGIEQKHERLTREEIAFAKLNDFHSRRVLNLLCEAALRDLDHQEQAEHDGVESLIKAQELWHNLSMPGLERLERVTGLLLDALGASELVRAKRSAKGSK